MTMTPTATLQTKAAKGVISTSRSPALIVITSSIQIEMAHCYYSVDAKYDTTTTTAATSPATLPPPPTTTTTTLLQQLNSLQLTQKRSD